MKIKIFKDIDERILATKVNKYLEESKEAYVDDFRFQAVLNVNNKIEYSVMVVTDDDLEANKNE